MLGDIKKKTKIIFVMILIFMLNTIPIYAKSSGDDLPASTALRLYIAGGQYYSQSTKKDYNYSEERFKVKGGGYLYYTELMDLDVYDNEYVPLFEEAKFQSLTADSKQDFLVDVLTLCNVIVYDQSMGNSKKGEEEITDETVEEFMEVLQQQSGMGSQLLAALLQDTKPNYVKASNIFRPFSDIVGTVLALISIVIVALLGVTMALDLAYMTIPAFYLACGGENGESKGVGGLISQEAKHAVQTAGASGGSSDGEYKIAVVTYFKLRWVGITALGICLLYLVHGQIYSFVAWLIDLMSGFAGF